MSQSGLPTDTVSGSSKVAEQHRREALEAGFSPDEWRGVFLLQGQRLSLSSFTISMNDRGEIASDGPKLATGIDMTPYWLSIAVEHAVRAEQLAPLTNEAWKTTEDPAPQVIALEAEFKSSVQAITAAAFAVDAFYATVQEEAPVPDATLTAWNKNKTSRSRRVFETFRRNFPLTPASQRALKAFLDQLFSFRDGAVHPTARTRDAIRHPRLPVSTDEIFCKFRAQNAWVTVGQVVEMLDVFASHPKIRSPKLADRMVPLKGLLEPIIESWRASPPAALHQNEQERARTS